MFTYFNEIQDPNMSGVDLKLMLMLDNAREFAGIPIWITSGFRTEEKNKEVNGEKDSAHLKGLAVDLACNDNKVRFKMVIGLLMAGFKRIKRYENHIHVDIDPTKEQGVFM